MTPLLPTLPRAQHAPELLDATVHQPFELKQSLAQVAAVNQWLGGASALLEQLTPLLDRGSGNHILDVGTASADLPRRIVQWCRRRNVECRVVATDIHAQMREIAQLACQQFPEIRIEAADALNLPYADDSFDVALMSLTLHHFEEGEQERALSELARVARRAVIVNELRRSRLNYAGAQLLAATVWRGNRLTRHDGPLSVLRAFTPDELLRSARRAGLRGRVHTHFFQRVVLVIDSAKAAAARTELK